MSQMSPPQIVTVTLPHHSYDVTVAPGILSTLGTVLQALGYKDRCALLGDERVIELYGKAVEHSLKEAGFSVLVQGFVPSETAKSLETVRGFYNTLIDSKFERTHPIIALGGGIAGDLVGFVAASYLRGVPFIQVPTTLLAMVDASIGGKVGVNLPQGKNLIGAFHQPRAVIIDPLVLQTLSDREFRCGLAECIKHGIIGDRGLFDWIKVHSAKLLSKDSAVLTELVSRNVAFKAKIVMSDEFEHGQRALLNLGHTFGHAIESATNYTKFLHGEAVSLGIIAACAVAELSGRAPAGTRKEAEEILTAAGLPIFADLPPVAVLNEAMTRDKKVRSGKIRLIVPDQIGSAQIVSGIAPELVTQAWISITRA